jgi:glycosyltransferase involved in cell wall biosynthesis
MTNNDQVNPQDLQRTVGEARLFLHSLPDPGYDRSFGYHPWFLRFWAIRGVKLAKKIRPSIVRCHSSWLNGYLASRIKKKYRIPYVVSMHINPDEDLRARATSAWEKTYWNAMEAVEKESLRHADMVLPVYRPIIPYLERMGVKKFEVAYNVLNADFLREKEDYSLHKPVRLISVGRHFKEKNPENIIRAIARLPNTHLTLVGDGPHQSYLHDVVQECQVENQVTFQPVIPNDELCRQLAECDIFVVHTEYWELSKSVLEALLTGLPVVINRRKGQPVPELQGDHVMLVENTPESYCDALTKLIDDDLFRENIGRRAYQHAQKNWAPAKTEAKYVEIYKRMIVGLIN